MPRSATRRKPRRPRPVKAAHPPLDDAFRQLLKDAAKTASPRLREWLDALLGTEPAAPAK